MLDFLKDAGDFFVDDDSFREFVPDESEVFLFGGDDAEFCGSWVLVFPEVVVTYNAGNFACALIVFGKDRGNDAGGTFCRVYDEGLDKSYDLVFFRLGPFVVVVLLDDPASCVGFSYLVFDAVLITEIADDEGVSFPVASANLREKPAEPPDG